MVILKILLCKATSLAHQVFNNSRTFQRYNGPVLTRKMMMINEPYFMTLSMMDGIRDLLGFSMVDGNLDLTGLSLVDGLLDLSESLPDFAVGAKPRVSLANLRSLRASIIRPSWSIFPAAASSCLGAFMNRFERG